MKDLLGENEVLKAEKQEMAERGLMAQETVSWQNKQLDEQARRLSELQAAARKAAAQLEAAAATEARLQEEGRAQEAREIASQARIASLTKQLEASRAEMAEMQERLMGFEGERRKLEARDTHTHIYMYIYAYIRVKAGEAPDEASRLRMALSPPALPPLYHLRAPGHVVTTPRAWSPGYLVTTPRRRGSISSRGISASPMRRRRRELGSA